MDPSSGDINQPAHATTTRPSSHHQGRLPMSQPQDQPQDQPQSHGQYRGGVVHHPLAFLGGDCHGQYLDATVHHFGLSQYYSVAIESSTPDPNGFALTYTSPGSTASDPVIPTQPLLQEPPQADSPSGSRRRRENRYRNAPPGVLSRRRAQNRASQRAYRERKEQRIRDLEQLLREAGQREQSLSQAYMALQAEYARSRVQCQSDTRGSHSPQHHHHHHHHQMGIDTGPFDVPPAEQASGVPAEYGLSMAIPSFPRHV